MSAVFNIIDTDHTGTIEFEEFWTFWKSSDKFRLHDAKKLALYRAAIAQFRQYDLDGNGSITLDEYKQISARAGWNKTEEELKTMMSKLDTDGDGEISFNEFVVWLNWGL